MANTDVKSIKSRQRQIVEIPFTVAIGASGAPTINVSQSVGITSITRTGAGVYDIVFVDGYQYLADYSVFQIGASQDLTFQVTTDFNTSTKTLSLTCKTANTATDPTNGTSLKGHFAFKNSSVI